MRIVLTVLLLCAVVAGGGLSAAPTDPLDAASRLSGRVTVKVDVESARLTVLERE